MKPMPQVLDVNLGCGAAAMPGAVVNVDRLALPGVDVVADLDSTAGRLALQHTILRVQATVRHVYALDLLEHLLHPMDFLDWCWELIRTPDGRLTLRVPDVRSPNCWLDPSHRRGYYPESFRFFDPALRGAFNRVCAREWEVISCQAAEQGNITVTMRPRID